MQKFIAAIGMVCGTAIGVGLIALPLALVKIGLGISVILVVLNLLISYRTSCIAIDVNHHLAKGTSIVECSKIMSGNGAWLLAMVSFFMLSFSLLSVYIACTADIVANLFDQKNSATVMILCGIMFYFLLSLRTKLLSNINSILFALLILVIFTLLFKISIKASPINIIFNGLNFRNILLALPIMFTSFGVQNICPYVYDYLDKNPKKTKMAFLIGIILTSLVYISWIYVVLNSIHSANPMFYERMLRESVNSGDLINVICEISGSKITKSLLTGLSLLAIVTSAIGIGTGLSISLKEILKKHVQIVMMAIPTMVILLVPNAFMNILSFGGMIATVFVIFLPIYLHSLIYKEKIYDIKNMACLGLAILVIIGEFLTRA